MTRKHYSLLVAMLLCLGANTLFAQDLTDKSWREHRRIAEKQEEAGQFEDAGDHYEKAYLQKNSKKELAYKAGECFYKAQNFPRAAKAYQFVKDVKDKDIELPALKYARSLKQAGQYEEASREFAYALNNYSGADKSTLQAVVDTDIKGCELGMKYAEETNKKSDTKIEWMSDNINSPENEFAPAPFGDDILYFASTMKGNEASLFRSQLQNGRWQKSSSATGFPKMPDGQLANGCFAPDGQRFYFTICKIEKQKRAADRFRCEIHMIKKRGSSWSEPQRLRDYINQPVHTSTQPCVAHKDGKEILYFSSDRDGGKGGLDIWYAVRDINSDDIDFTLPKNAGSINSKGDEVTPFYDTQDGTLYFSSNGQISLGGMDIFKSKGAESQWGAVENIGLPYNSSVDDIYFVLKKSHTGGFLASNRISGKDKITTNNQDIFEFSTTPPAPDLTARGSIFDQTNKSLMKDVNVSLYEINTDGQKRLLTGKVVEAVYEFTLLPNKTYTVEGEKTGYRTAVVNFNTKDGGKAATYGESLYLEKGDKTEPAKTVSDPVAANQSAPNSEETPLRTIDDTKPDAAAAPATSSNSKTNGKVNNTTKPSKQPPTATPSNTSNATANNKNMKPAPAATKPATVVTQQQNDLEDLPTTRTTTRSTTTQVPEPAVATSSRKSESKTNKESNKNKTVAAAPTKIMSEPAAAVPTTSITTMAGVAGNSFKLQVGAFRNFEPSRAKKYEKAKEFGELNTEPYAAENMTRLVVGQFSSHADATLALRKLRKKGFRDAFVAYYSDGVRLEK